MRFDELDINEKLHICFKLNDKDFDFEQTIVNKINGFLLVEAIRVKEQIISFKESNLKIEVIYYRENEKPICWYFKDIKSIRDKNGKTFYCFRGDLEGISINRRNNFRVYIGLNADAQVGANKSVERVIVKDISNSGFAIIKEEQEENFENELVRVSFDDTKIGNHIALVGFVTRVKKLDNGKMILGCKLSKEPSNLSEYLSMKQRSDIARKLRVPSRN